MSTKCVLTSEGKGNVDRFRTFGCLLRGALSFSYQSYKEDGTSTP